MAQTVFHSSIEGGQHSSKGLEGFLRFARASGAQGAQPSNYMLKAAMGGFRTAAEIKSLFDPQLRLDGISCHCIFWVHGTAWTRSPTIRPFIPQELWDQSPARIEEWCEKYLEEFFYLCRELNVRIVPMFWGNYYGWEVATGYPWGFWTGPNYDLIKEGDYRFLKSTERIRQLANDWSIVLAHEIHPGTAAMCADDFLHLVKIADNDPCLGVNADPSHCWEGESWQNRLAKVGQYVYGCHVKSHVVRPGHPLRSMQPNWPDRAMQFTDLRSGEINLVRYVETLKKIGYPERYCQLMGTKTAPLITEAESAFRDLDDTARDAITYTNKKLLFPFATESFEDGMGAEK